MLRRPERKIDIKEEVKKKEASAKANAQAAELRRNELVEEQKNLEAQIVETKKQLAFVKDGLSREQDSLIEARKKRLIAEGELSSATERFNSNRENFKALQESYDAQCEEREKELRELEVKVSSARSDAVQQCVHFERMIKTGAEEYDKLLNKHNKLSEACSSFNIQLEQLTVAASNAKKTLMSLESDITSKQELVILVDQKKNKAISEMESRIKELKDKTDELDAVNKEIVDKGEKLKSVTEQWETIKRNLLASIKREEKIKELVPIIKETLAKVGIKSDL